MCELKVKRLEELETVVKKQLDEIREYSPKIPIPGVTVVNRPTTINDFQGLVEFGDDQSDSSSTTVVEDDGLGEVDDSFT